MRQMEVGRPLPDSCSVQRQQPNSLYMLPKLIRKDTSLMALGASLAHPGSAAPTPSIGVLSLAPSRARIGTIEPCTRRSKRASCPIPASSHLSNTSLRMSDKGPDCDHHGHLRNLVVAVALQVACTRRVHADPLWRNSTNICWVGHSKSLHVVGHLHRPSCSSLQMLNGMARSGNRNARTLEPKGLRTHTCWAEP